ncbi:MAG: hypothetical protein ABFD18_18375 [Syntrophomonas sp.]
MAGKEKDSKKGQTVKRERDNQCPAKDESGCKVPGVFSDSEPIGGGG